MNLHVDIVPRSRRLAKRLLKTITPALYKHVPIGSWPPLMAAIHGISVPRAVVPNAAPLPIGGANINNLIQLLAQTRDVPGSIAECGVFRGHSLVSMGIYLKQQGITKKIYGFDSFEGFASDVVEDLSLGGTNPEWKQPGVMRETSLQLVQGKLRRFGLEVQLVRGFFEHTLPLFESLTFSFVHLDCDAYSAYRQCLEFFYPRLNAGGVILLDEYNDPPWPGCKKAVDEFLYGKPEKLQVISCDNYQKSYFVKQAPAGLTVGTGAAQGSV